MIDATPTKLCTGCKVEKPHAEFNVDRQKSTGLASRCKECHRDQCRRYMQTPRGRERARAAGRKFAAANPEKVAAATAAWRAKNPGYSAEANRLWRLANPGAAAAYHQANRDAAIRRVNRRRERIKATSTDEPVDLDALWVLQEGFCALCGDPIDRDLRYPDPLSKSVDHIVPLSKGGTHEQANLQWTHLVCNIRKGAAVPA